MRKKIFINESKLKQLYEDYNQMVIPFETIKDKDGNTLFYGNDNGRKLNYQYFMDFLESFGKKGTLQPSDFDWSSEIDSHKLDAFDSLYLEYNEPCNVIDDMFFGYYGAVNFIEKIRECIPNANFELNDDATITIKSPEVLENIDISCSYSDFFDVISEVFNFDERDFYEHITDADKLRYIDKYMGEYDFPNGISVDDRGLIYIEREINIPFYLNNKNSKMYGNFYTILRDNYGEHIGQYWSWKKGGANAYNAEYYDGKSTKIIFCGYVDPKNIDWEQTVLKSCWNFREEQEIEVQYGEEIEIDAVYLKHGKNDAINLLKEPMIVYA